jgi:hypothetical protein
MELKSPAHDFERCYDNTLGTAEPAANNPFAFRLVRVQPSACAGSADM